MTEKHLQRATATLLDTLRLRWCHVPNGGLRNARVGAELKRQGVKRGVPDVLIFVPSGEYVGLAIELKVGRNRLTPEQADWLAGLESAGWATAVCHDIDEVIAALRKGKYYRAGGGR